MTESEPRGDSPFFEEEKDADFDVSGNIDRLLEEYKDNPAGNMEEHYDNGPDLPPEANYNRRRNTWFNVLYGTIDALVFKARRYYPDMPEEDALALDNLGRRSEELITKVTPILHEGKRELVEGEEDVLGKLIKEGDQILREAKDFIAKYPLNVNNHEDTLAREAN